MNEFETVTLYRSTLEDVMRHTILRAAWWGIDNPEKDAIKYSEETAKERTEWIVRELTFDAITKKIQGETDEILRRKNKKPVQ